MINIVTKGLKVIQSMKVDKMNKIVKIIILLDVVKNR